MKIIIYTYCIDISKGETPKEKKEMSNMRYSVVAISPRNVNNIITQWFKTGEEAGEYACDMAEGGFRCIVLDNQDSMTQVYVERDIYGDTP